MKRLSLLLLALALGVTAGCSAEKPAAPAAEPAVKEEPQPQSSTARVAFQRILPQARLWAPDAQPSRIESHPTEQDRGAGGTSTIWRVHMVSRARTGMRTFVWSGATGEYAPERGVSSTTEDRWSPTNRETMPFDLAFLRVDSDAAFEVGQKRGGAAILKKDPEHPVAYLLDWDPQRNQLVWHVYYGTDRRNAELRVAVNASTGEFLRIER